MPYVDGILYEFDRAINTATIKRIAKTNRELKVVIPADVLGFKVTHIAPNAFENHIRMQEIALPYTLEEIGNFAFMNCRDLKKVQISGGNLLIGQKAFSHCVNLEQINSNRLINIRCTSHSAFANCYSLKSFSNIEFVGLIYDSMFYRCSALTELSFGHNTEIKSGSLTGCRMLKTIRLDGNIAVPSKTMQKQFKAYKLICTEVTTILDWVYDGYCVEINDDYLPF